MGNHEADYPGFEYFNGTDSGGECGVPTRTLFPMPWPSFEEPWFAVATGPLLVVHMTTEWDFTPGSAQYDWIKATLGAVDRAATPWGELRGKGSSRSNAGKKPGAVLTPGDCSPTPSLSALILLPRRAVFFVGHRPMYISSTNDNPDPKTGSDQGVALSLRAHVEPLLMNAGGRPVDLSLWGHHHSYQRHCASFAGQCVTHSSQAADGSFVFTHPQAPVQMVIGTAGAGYSTNVQTPPPPFNEFVSFTHGFAAILLHNDSHLQWSFVNDADGSTLETMWIVRA